MGLFDDVAGNILGGGAQNKLAELALNLVSDNASGGLSGLAKIFAEKGLGDVVASWVSTGENQPVSGDQISQALGSEKIGEIAQQLGIGQQDAANGLAGLLPEIIDKLTPDGQVPDADVLTQGLNLLKGRLFG